MTKVLIIDPKSEILLHSLQIINKESVKRADSYIASEQKFRGVTLERILIREGLVTIMEPGDVIPIPVERFGVNPR